MTHYAAPRIRQRRDSFAWIDYTWYTPARRRVWALVHTRVADEHMVVAGNIRFRVHEGAWDYFWAGGELAR